MKPLRLKLQEEAQQIFMDLDFEYQRVPSQIFLVASPLPVLDSGELVNMIEKKEHWKILCLDQITDVHNGAAILRSASFYGVDALVFSSKNTFSPAKSVKQSLLACKNSLPNSSSFLRLSLIL